MDVQLTLNNFYQLLGRFTTADLQDMVNKYPYLPQAHLLLAKKYQLENSPRFDEQLQLAALYAQDRELLFTIFSEKTIAFKEEEPVEEVVKTTEVNLPKEVAAVEDNVAIEEPPVEETAPVTEDVLVEAPVETLVEVAPLVVEVPGEELKSDDFSVAEPHTFGEWLQVYGKLGASIQQHSEPETSGDENTIEQKEDELDRLILENTPVNFLQDLVEEETHYSRGLDKFIEEQIQRHKQPEIKKAAADNDIDTGLVTETMAKVYEMQKKYTKAIQVYEALKIKYPEKHDYFSMRINIVKNLL